MRKAPLAVVVAIILVACTDPGVTATTPGGPSSTAPVTPTTNPPLVDGGLIPIDPATLVPLADADPLVVADVHSGVVSPNRRWAAIQSWTVAGDSPTITLVDLSTMTVTASIEPTAEVHDLTVTDTGEVYWLLIHATLLQQASETGEVETVYRLPNGLHATEFDILADGKVGLLGGTYGEGAMPGTLVVIDLDAGTHAEVALDSVMFGLDADEGDDPQPFAHPALIWDRERALIVEASRDVVTEVDPASGDIIEHPWFRPTSFLDGLMTWLTPRAQAKSAAEGTRREVHLSPDGTRLFVATSVTEVDASLNQQSSPLEIVVIDTTTWTATVLDEVADTLRPSPDGSFLLAQGTDHGESMKPSPVWVIDPTTAEVLGGFQVSDSGPADIQFSSDSRYAYLKTTDDHSHQIHILDLTALQLTGAVDFREINLVGEAGLMAFQLD